MLARSLLFTWLEILIGVEPGEGRRVKEFLEKVFEVMGIDGNIIS